MTDFNKSIVATADNGFRWLTSLQVGGTWGRFGNAGGNPYHAYFRFTNVTIPKDAFISSAILRFEAAFDKSVTVVRLNIYIEDADDPLAPTSAFDFDNRSMGNAQAWDNEGSWLGGNSYDSDDFKNILENHFSRVGWSSGQALTIFIKDDGSDSNAERIPAFYDHATAAAPELRVTYTIGIAGTLTDSFTIDDQIGSQGGSTFSELADNLVINDSIIAAGGSTFATAADNLTIDDSIIAQGPVPVDLSDDINAFDIIVAGFQYERDLSDDLTMDDQIVVGFEYQGPLSDDFTISDLTDALNWSEFLRENQDIAIVRYYFTLTGDADNESDQELPFTSFQSTKRTEAATYLSVIVPGFQYSSQIMARSNGSLKIDMAYIVDGAESFRETIIEVDLETVRIDEGTRRRAITLSGSRVIEYKENLITLENPIYQNISEGKVRYRFLQADPWLNAGDTVRCRSDEFVVDYITYTISDRFKQMEVSGT